MKSKFKNTIYILLLLICACSRGPEPIAFGKDACAWCKMTIMDPKFGSELVTEKGRVYKFDDVNCLVEYMVDKNYTPQEDHMLYVLDYGTPGELIEAKSASYIFSKEIRSPMASRTAAFSEGDLQQKYLEEWSGDKISWDEVWSRFSEDLRKKI